MGKSKLHPPKTSAGDEVHLMARSLLSMIPTVGGPAVELLNRLIAPPFERRQKQWMEDVGNILEKLIAKSNFSIDELQQDEGFVDSILKASQIALRTHQKEKLDALKNCISNSAGQAASSSVEQQMFLSFIDDFNEWHIKLLKLFENPTKTFGPILHVFSTGLSNLIEDNFPELKNQRELYDVVWHDLYRRGLVNTEQLHSSMTGSGLTAKRTTAFGDRFLRFITSD